MAKPEWGKKRTCQSCGTKYYDLNKTPMICPSCGAEFDPELLLKTRKGKSLSSKTISDNENNLTADISNLDDIETDSDSEVVSDDEPLLEINEDDQNNIVNNDDGIVIDEDISFIDDEGVREDDEISDENSINVDIIEEDKD